MWNQAAHAHRNIVFVFTKESVNVHFVLRSGVMFRLWSKSHFCCMFLSAESAAGHLASPSWAEECPCSLHQTNDTVKRGAAMAVVPGTLHPLHSAGFHTFFPLHRAEAERTTTAVAVLCFTGGLHLLCM